MNRDDGTFEVKPTTFSGLDAGGISGEAADLNNDGLLDLVFASDPDNSGLAQSMERMGRFGTGFVTSPDTPAIVPLYADKAIRIP